MSEKITPQNEARIEAVLLFSVASELMCVYVNGNCGNFIQGFVTAPLSGLPIKTHPVSYAH